MKAAKANDYWRHVYERPYNPILERVTYTNIVNLGSGGVSFHGGITAICGVNGAGKTALLEAVRGVLDPSQIVNPVTKLRLGNCTLTAVVTINGEQRTSSARFDVNSEPIQDEGRQLVIVTWLDPGFESVGLANWFATTPNFHEILDAIQPRELAANELSLVSYMVGKDYQSCQVFEIDEFDEEPAFPYFRVSCDGTSYGSETMGLGELSLHLIYWYLNRVPNSSILLLEEPETHVSYRSQIALLDVIAKLSSERSIWVIITTHSPGIVAKVPTKHVRMVFRAGGSVTLREPTAAELQATLGIKSQLSGVLLVEDRAAKHFVKAWLRAFDDQQTIMPYFDIVVAGSSGAISEALGKFPKTGSWLKILGLFDGDMRNHPISGNLLWPYTFLPGDEAPEQLLQRYAVGNMARVSDQLNQISRRAEFILSDLAGRDHHDWLVELGQRLNVESEHLVSELFGVWVSDEQNNAVARQAFERLVQLIKPPE